MPRDWPSTAVNVQPVLDKLRRIPGCANQTEFVVQNRRRYESPVLRESPALHAFSPSHSQHISHLLYTSASLHEQFALLEARVLRQQNEPAAPVGGPDLSALTYGINHHLEDRKDIQKKLWELNVSGSTFFGADVLPPAGRNVSLARALSQEYVRSIVALARDLKFETYSFISGEEDIVEDVLFGSYGQPEFEINR